MPLKVRFRVLCAMLALMLMSSPIQAADTNEHNADLEQARSLIAQGKASAAYAMLEANEFDRAGDVDFDTVLGIAALDSGKPDKATLAFERVLAVDPNAAGKEPH